MVNWRELEQSSAIDKVQPTEELKQEFIKRTKKHIELVNKYAAKLGKSYPNHDKSKLDTLLDGYCFYCKPKEERTPEEQEVLDIVTLIHIKNAPHHAEYWTDTALDGFTRANYTPNGIVDVQHMPPECVEEMVCDWKATAEEKGNTATEWFKSVNGTRWLFTPEQQTQIRNILSILE